MNRRAVAALAWLAVSAWLVHRDSAFDLFRAPLFWPFLFSAGLTTALSTSAIADDPRGWRALVGRIAAGAGIVAGGGAWLGSRNPINGIGALDIVALAALAASIVGVAGAATAWARHDGAPAWVKTAACLAAVLSAFWLTPHVIGALHGLLS